MSTPPFAKRRDHLGPRFAGTARLLLALGLVVLGEAVGLALGLVAGAGHSRTTTVIELAPATASVAGSARGPWKSVYAQAAAGTIDLAVQSTTIVNTPFGERA